MSTYQIVVTAVRTAITPLLQSPATGTFKHGRIVDASLRSIAETLPLVVLYPFTITPPVSPQVMHSSDLLVGFWQQDGPATSEEEREAIIAAMDLLSDAFLVNLKAYDKRFGTLRLLKEPAYQQYAGTMSGVLVRLSYLTVGPC